MTAPKERPVNFPAQLIAPTLAGTKTHHRVIIKNPINGLHTGGHPVKLFADWALSGLIEFNTESGIVSFDVQCAVDDSRVHKTKCPYGTVGDRLWVREAWAAHESWNSVAPSHIRGAFNNNALWFSDGSENVVASCGGSRGKMRHSMHMPRWASRLTLEIVSVRVERLQDISEADAVAEGIRRFSPPAECVSEEWPRDGNGWLRPTYDAKQRPKKYQCPVTAYRHLWESINGPGSWALNPWVFALEFRKVESL